MKNSKLKDLLKATCSDKPSQAKDITFLNEDDLNQIGGGSCGSSNSCGYYGHDAKDCPGTNSCSWYA